VNAEYTANATNENARQLQNTLYLAAKENPKRKFHALYDKVFRKDILQEAWARVKINRGSAPVYWQGLLKSDVSMTRNIIKSQFISCDLYDKAVRISPVSDINLGG
jgi:hypothetical protein